MVLKHPHILKLIEVIRRTVNENKQFTLIYEFTEVGNALDYFLKKKKVYENDVAIVPKTFSYHFHTFTTTKWFMASFNPKIFSFLMKKLATQNLEISLTLKY